MNTATNKPPVSPKLAISLAILAVSTAALFIRLAQEEVSSITVAAYRLGLATLCLAPFYIHSIRNQPIHISKKQGSLLLLGGVFLAFHFVTWITSLAYTSVASSVVLVSTTPLWVAFFSPVLLKEQLNRYAIIGMVIALVGGTLVGISDICGISASGISCKVGMDLFSGKALLGDVLALLGALFSGGYLMIGRKLRSNLDLPSYTFYVYGTAAITLIILALATHQPLVGFSAKSMVWLVALAIIPQLFGHSTFNWALKHLPAGIVSIFLLGEPIGSTILAAVFLKEIPGFTKVCGGVLILIGIWLSTRSD